jgi:hypothetical protein
MAHQIFGQRFYGRRQPAWHRLGHVSEDSIGAVEAFNRFGPYRVTLEPRARTSGMAEPEWEILCYPTLDDPDCRSFGTVGPEYVLITPQESTAMWDRCVRRAVETLGALQEGRCLFITTELPSFDVRGDEVQNYLILAHWMAPGYPSQAFQSPVRVVCMNTMRLAERLASERMRLEHTSGVKDRMAAGLTGVVARAVPRSEGIKHAFERMARHQVTGTEAQEVVQAAYPEPPRPGNAPVHEMRDRWNRYEIDAQLVRAQRAAALDLFAGAGTGMDRDATRGTMWGLYNAIVELENYRQGGTDAQAATEVLVGDRAAVMQRAFSHALELACGRVTHPERVLVAC